ncbi:MAG: hypothetical protein U0836_14555 [Pirellulales bacterium]
MAADGNTIGILASDEEHAFIGFNGGVVTPATAHALVHAERVGSFLIFLKEPLSKEVEDILAAAYESDQRGLGIEMSQWVRPELLVRPDAPDTPAERPTTPPRKAPP